MACVPQTSHPEKIEHLLDQNGCHRKDGLEVTNAKVVGYENDDWEKDSAHDASNDIHFPPQRCLSTADRVQDTEYDNAICHLEDHMEVNLASIQENSDVDNVGQVSFRKRRKQNSRRMLEEMLALSEQGELLEDDDEGDDRDWEPFEQFAVLTKWFCTNCTMANFGDSVYCDLCGEHQNSDLITAGIPSKCEVPGERLEETKNSAVTFSFPTPPILEESFTQASHRRTAVGFDERMLLHSEIEMKSHPHPERPDRLRAIAASLAAAGLFPGKCFPISAREITCQELAMVHTLEHVNAVELTSCKISSYFTADTYANQHSALAAKLAAGLCADLATTIMTGQAQNGFALVRPPGHHAGVKDSMGFCLHNNAAIAVSASRAAGAKKVLILDWDVHHGNGTQEIFYSDNSVLYISLHRYEGGHFYPGSGAAREVGSCGGEGYSVNIPWKRGGVGDNDYIFAFQHVVIPIAEQFAPDLTIISAGFDAAKGDPLGCCEVTPTGFANMTQMLIGPAKGKLLIILEGGYNLRSISASATAVLKVLVGDNPEPLPPEIGPSKAGFKTVLEVLEIQSKYWASVKRHYLKLYSQWKTLYTRKKRKIKMKKFIVGGPIWWKWGRKRVVYDHWFARLHLRNHSR